MEDMIIQQNQTQANKRYHHFFQLSLMKHQQFQIQKFANFIKKQMEQINVLIVSQFLAASFHCFHKGLIRFRSSFEEFRLEATLVGSSNPCATWVVHCVVVSNIRETTPGRGPTNRGFLGGGFKTRSLGEMIQFDNHLTIIFFKWVGWFNQALIATSYFWGSKNFRGRNNPKEKTYLGGGKYSFFFSAFPTNFWGEL